MASEIRALAVRLMLFAMIAALLLALVNEVTKEPIAENLAMKARASRIAVIGEYAFTPLSCDLTEYPMIQGVYVATQADPVQSEGVTLEAIPELGEPLGYVYELSNRGYGGEIALSVGVSAAGEVTGVAIASHSETKGLGTSAETDFLGAFTGIQAEPARAQSVDAMSGATVSSNGVRGAVAQALEHYQTVLAGAGEEAAQ